VFENIRCSLLGSRGSRYSFWHVLARQPALNAEAERLLDAIRLTARRDVAAGLLSYAEQRALEIGFGGDGQQLVTSIDKP